MLRKFESKVSRTKRRSAGNHGGRKQRDSFHDVRNDCGVYPTEPLIPTVGNKAGHEWPLTAIRHCGGLTVEQCDLWCEQQVCSLIALCGLDEEECFQIAENRRYQSEHLPWG